MNSYLPFTLFGDLSRNFDSRGEPAEKARRAWAPAVDISEAGDAYLLSMDVPGISREAIEVSVDGGVLTVKGERTIDYADAKLAVNERWQGEFVRRFSLWVFSRRCSSSFLHRLRARWASTLTRRPSKPLALD